MQRSLLLTPPLNLLRSPSIRYSSSRSTPTPTSSTPDEPSSAPSASSYLAQQALLEEEELAETVRKNKRLPPELREPVWEGEETREAMLKRILEDQYKPLRVKVSFHLPINESHGRERKKGEKLIFETECARVGLSKTYSKTLTSPLGTVRLSFLLIFHLYTTTILIRTQTTMGVRHIL